MEEVILKFEDIYPNKKIAKEDKIKKTLLDNTIKSDQSNHFECFKWLCFFFYII